ncbi:helix-turn-helix domain-containing protein [Streptomyces rishiriensis]|uniref:helix-turn-helix domain-containing protein n=1 Tax=Streptomyces rishiriensis TaxID=68264 RepID=UPI001C3F8636
MTSGRCWSGGRVERHRQGLALRARLVLACAGPEAPPIVAVARELRVTADTVRKWRRRFLAERLDGLADEPRPGRPPTSASIRSKRSWSPRWNSCRRTPPTGRGHRWPSTVVWPDEHS